MFLMNQIFEGTAQKVTSFSMQKHHLFQSTHPAMFAYISHYDTDEL